MRKNFKKTLSIFLSVLMMVSAFSAVTAFAEEIKDGWNTEQTMYYVDSAPVKEEIKEIDNQKYYFDANGIKATGLVKIDDDYFYFNETGVMQTGWKKINDNKFYFDAETGAAYKGIHEIDGYYYRFSNTGRMKTGFYNEDGDRYYFLKSGKAATGLKKINGKLYFFSKKGIMKTGFVKIKGATYYFNNSKEKYGRAVKGLVKVKKKYYFFSTKNAKMKTGWVTYKGKKYYFTTKKKNRGAAYTGIKKIKDKKYKFSNKGVCLGEYVAMDDKANNYSSPTKYLILVNKTTHKVGIYKGKKGSWTRIKYWDCTTGAPGTRTPSGNFLIGPSGGKPFHQLYFDSAAIRCWYATRIVGGYNFHSVLYTQQSSPRTIANGRLGYNLSHGCIRLKLDNAKWLYKTIPAKTRCVIYNADK